MPLQMKFNKVFFLFLSLISLSTFAACDQEQPQLRLTSSERIKVDTLFTESVKTFRPYLDSICDANRDSLIKAAVDSLLIVRKAEEKRLRARIPKESVSKQ